MSQVLGEAAREFFVVSYIIIGCWGLGFREEKERFWDSGIQEEKNIARGSRGLARIEEQEDFEILGFWDSGILGFWDSGISGFWDFGILGFWDFGILGFWDFGIEEWLEFLGRS